MGGTPLTLLSAVQEELDRMKKANITPFFVSSGLSILKERVTNNARAQKLAGAWESYYKGQYELAEKQFGEIDKTLSKLPYVPQVLDYISKQGIETFRAPYVQHPQLALFSDPSQKNYLNSVWGSIDLLLYGVYRLIVNIDFEKGAFEWIDLKNILGAIQLTHEQFVDACILCGFEYCPTFPAFGTLHGPNLFKAACERVKAHHTGSAAIQDASYMMPGGMDHYYEMFMKTKCLIRNHMVYYPSGVCEPIYKDLTYQVKQTDLNNIFGPKLPNDLYFYISQGFTNQALSNIVNGHLTEPAPLVDSEQIRRMLDYLKDIRTLTISVLTSVLSEDISNRVIKNTRWYEPGFDLPHTNRLSNSPFGKNSKSLVLPADVKAQIQSNTSPLTFSFVAKCCATSPIIPSTIDEPAIVPIRDTKESTFYILYETLSLMGYIGQDGKLTAYGRVLEQVKHTKFHEEIVLAIELIRSGCLTAEQLNFIPKPSFSSPVCDASTLLLSRLLSLVPCDLDATPWDGPIDHDLLSFYEIGKTLSRTLRNLGEQVALSHLTTHKIVVEPSECASFSSNLPFFRHTSTATGLISKGLLIDGLSIADLEDVFPNCTNITGDLERATDFIGEVVSIVNALHKEGLIPESLHTTFTEAEKNWTTRRQNQLKQ
eukprot:gene14225-16784_t